MQSGNPIVISRADCFLSSDNFTITPWHCHDQIGQLVVCNLKHNVPLEIYRHMCIHQCASCPSACYRKKQNSTEQASLLPDTSISLCWHHCRLRCDVALSCLPQPIVNCLVRNSAQSRDLCHCSNPSWLPCTFISCFLFIILCQSSYHLKPTAKVNTVNRCLIGMATNDKLMLQLERQGQGCSGEQWKKMKQWRNCQTKS